MTGSALTPVAPPTEAPSTTGHGTAPQTGPPPSHPRRTEGRTHAFREREVARRAARRENIGVIVVVVILALGILTILTARPNSSSSYSFPSPGPPIAVTLGSPSVSPVTCGDGTTGYAEKVPWVSASESVTTGDVNVRVYEIWDGDYIGDADVIPNATATNPCAGSPPMGTGLFPGWYVVLAAPNGTNLLTYTTAKDWTSITSEPWNFEIQNDSTLIVVTSVSLAGTGRGIAVTGFAAGSPISGSTPL